MQCKELRKFIKGFLFTTVLLDENVDILMPLAAEATSIAEAKDKIADYSAVHQEVRGCRCPTSEKETKAENLRRQHARAVSSAAWCAAAAC